MKYRSPMAATILAFVLAQPVAAATDSVQELLNEYSAQGASDFSADRGFALWNTSVNGRRCGSCHTGDPRVQGAHQDTKKEIEPLAPSVNAKRFQATKSIRKWLKRNCKWTLGRECSAQEKGDFLTWISVQ